MKIRNGFVSNSSTSSFLIYGISAESSELNVDDVYDTAEKNGLICYHLEYEYYIGESWSKVKDEQTGLQFKESVQEKIKKAFPDYKGKFGTFKEAWGDY